jgi:quercetin dioxygenase-like cupin family protein
MRIRIAVLAFLFATVASAQTPAPEVAITAEPAHHRVLENAHVRVFRLEAPPEGGTLLHEHGHDYFLVSLGPGDFENAVVGKEPVRVKLADGDVRFAPGGFSHVARNLGAAPLRNLTIELLQGETGAAQPVTPTPEELKPRELVRGTMTLLMVKDGVRVSEIRLQAGGSIPKHRHAGPHMMVAVTDLALRSEVEGSEPSTREVKAGEVAWIPGGIEHTVTNAASGDVRFVAFEIPETQAP